MSQFATIARELVDPSGRCNRKGLLVLACVILALETAVAGIVYAAGIEPVSPLAVALKCVFFWTAIVAATKRLHDLGRSGWWIAAGLAGLVVWAFALAMAMLLTFGPRALESNPVINAGIVLSTMVPAFAALLWLHFAKGQQASNQHGPAPERLGFARARRQASFAEPMLASA